LKKSKIKNKRILADWKNEFGALILAFFEKKGFCLVKWAKTNAFFDTQDEG